MKAGVRNFKGSKLPFAPEVSLLAYSLSITFRFGDSGIRFSPYLSACTGVTSTFSVINNFDEGALHNGQLPYWSFDLNLRSS